MHGSVRTNGAGGVTSCWLQIGQQVWRKDIDIRDVGKLAVEEKKKKKKKKRKKKRKIDESREKPG